MPEVNGTPLLAVRDLRTRFHTRRGVVHAVEDVTFDVGHGSLLGIVGETGCGKSATIRSILGLVRPPGRVLSGSAVFEGEDLLGLAPKQLRKLRGARIGFVAQHPWGALNPILKIRKQFYNIITAHRTATTDECHDMALEALQDVEISGPKRVLDGYAHELSGGMAQRVVIAMAMILQPRLVIADEPTTALDVTVQRQILDLMQALISEGRRSMVLVTHDLGVVAQYCDSVVVMYAGKVVESGLVADVFTRPAHPYTNALLESVPRAGEPLIPLSGRVPDLTDYPTGCPYRDRCKYAHDRCLVEAPLPREVGPGREVSCHLDLIEEVSTDVAPVD